MQKNSLAADICHAPAGAGEKALSEDELAPGAFQLQRGALRRALQRHGPGTTRFRGITPYFTVGGYNLAVRSLVDCERFGAPAPRVNSTAHSVRRARSDVVTSLTPHPCVFPLMQQSFCWGVPKAPAPSVTRWRMAWRSCETACSARRRPLTTALRY
jgi:hypothetical protein